MNKYEFICYKINLSTKNLISFLQPTISLCELFVRLNLALRRRFKKNYKIKIKYLKKLYDCVIN